MMNNKMIKYLACMLALKPEHISCDRRVAPQVLGGKQRLIGEACVVDLPVRTDICLSVPPKKNVQVFENFTCVPAIPDHSCPLPFRNCAFHSHISFLCHRQGNNALALKALKVKF
jgi:hypothetical protein